MQQVAVQKSPPPYAVLPFFAFGAIAWLAVTIIAFHSSHAFAGHYFSPALLSITHLLVLGWITMIIFGAMYQLLPVVMNKELYSPGLALATFFLLAPGSMLIAYSFMQFRLDFLMHIGATLVILAATLFAFNVARTSAGSGSSIEKDFILTSVVWLLFTVVSGFILAINLTTSFIPVPHLELLKLHAHAGIAGWIIQLIFGVGSKLLPMFLVAHRLGKRKLTFAWYFTNAGLVTGIVSLYIQWSPGVALASLCGIAGVVCFVLYILEAYRKRSKRKPDTGMILSMASFFWLGAAVFLLLLLLIKPQFIQDINIGLSIAYGSLILIGFVTALILGQTYKTLPFIIWLLRYKSLAGKKDVPYPSELYSAKAAWFQFILYNAGFFIMLSGIVTTRTDWISAGCIFLIISALIYNYNVFKILLHKPIAANIQTSHMHSTNKN